MSADALRVVETVVVGVPNGRLDRVAIAAVAVAAPSEACPQPAAVVEIHAVPDDDIYLELVWHTAGDADESDTDGSDVDLHLLHPGGRAWATAPADCYYDNRAPDWGPRGPSGNPSFEIEDSNGAGPEALTLNTPEDTARQPGGD